MGEEEDECARDVDVLLFACTDPMGDEVGGDDDGSDGVRDVGGKDGGCGVCRLGTGFWCCEFTASIKLCTGDELLDAGREKGKEDIGGVSDEGGGGPEGLGGS
jgi:hypothetical protein